MNSRDLMQTLCWCALILLGYLVPLWPLAALGILLLSLSGRWFVSLLAGLALDLLWGPPAGFLHALYAPFTLLALVAALARLAGQVWLIEGGLPEHL